MRQTNSIVQQWAVPTRYWAVIHIFGAPGSENTCATQVPLFNNTEKYELDD